MSATNPTGMKVVAWYSKKVDDCITDAKKEYRKRHLLDHESAGFNEPLVTLADAEARISELRDALIECVEDMHLTELCYGSHDGAQDAITRAEAVLSKLGEKGNG